MTRSKGFRQFGGYAYLIDPYVLFDPTILRVQSSKPSHWSVADPLNRSRFLWSRHLRCAANNRLPKIENGALTPWKDICQLVWNSWAKSSCNGLRSVLSWVCFHSPNGCNLCKAQKPPAQESSRASATVSNFQRKTLQRDVDFIYNCNCYNTNTRMYAIHGSRKIVTNAAASVCVTFLGVITFLLLKAQVKYTEPSLLVA